MRIKISQHQYMCLAVTLPDPVKQRDGGPKEEAKLSEFQEELVQMAATLNGDCKKDIYPQKLVEGMNVRDAINYVDDAFKKFLDDCDKAKKGGADESEIVQKAKKGVDESEIVASASPPPKMKSKSFAHKIFSCLACNN